MTDNWWVVLACDACAVRDYILRIYGCLFAVVIIMLEMNVQFIIKGFAVLDNWVIRGLFYGL